MPKPFKSRDYSFLIATCAEYPQGNESLEQLKITLEQKGFACCLQNWREILLDSLDLNTIILPLAIWDYSLYYPIFLDFLRKIEQFSLKIVNPISLILWNLSKDYLLDLEKRGLPIIPSLVLYPDTCWEDKIMQKGWHNPVIKPLVGQSGRGVLRFGEQPFKQSDYPFGAIAQPFMESIYTQGEVCLVFFGQEYQYAIHRKPAPKQWRANSNYGVTTHRIEASNQWIEIAKNAVMNLPFKSCYARVDLLPQDNQKALISEVELIEPSLYFSLYAQVSVQNFMASILEFFKG